MNKTLVTIAGLALVAVIGWQTYMIYNLKHQVQQLTEPLATGGGEPFFTPGPNEDVFGDDGWEPYREFQHMQQEFDRVFGNAFSRFHLNRGPSRITKMPALDLQEDADRYIVKMDLPGADMSSLAVDLNDRQLSITVKTEQQDAQRPGSDRRSFRRRERFFGTFHRSVTLPGPVDASAMKSDYKNGVLTVVVPKG